MFTFSISLKSSSNLVPSAPPTFSLTFCDQETQRQTHFNVLNLNPPAETRGPTAFTDTLVLRDESESEPEEEEQEAAEE